jgi:hypothetical protein
MSERDAQLRQELVDLADEQRAAPRRSTRTLVASVVAFAVAGAITGGTVAAVASSDDSDSELDLISVRVMGLQLVGNHSPILGEPLEQLGHAHGEVELSAMPPGANAIAFALHCTEVGTYSFALNGAEVGSISCSDESDTKPGHGGMSMFLTPDPTSDNTITISVEGSGGYSVWAAWVARPTPQEPSAEQAAALADGVVDEQEYLAGLNRYIDCVAQAGFTIDVLDTGEPVARYVVPDAAVQDGADERCYAAEFRELDIEWQISQEQRAP